MSRLAAPALRTGSSAVQGIAKKQNSGSEQRRDRGIVMLALGFLRIAFEINVGWDCCPIKSKDFDTGGTP